MKYYAFIAGLPDLIAEDYKKIFTISEFKEELTKLLSWRDQKLIHKLFLKHDNYNLLSYLKFGKDEIVFDPLGNYTMEDIFDMVEDVKDEDRKWKRKYPLYFKTFIEDYLASEEEQPFFMEDHLAGLYYQYIGKTRNEFLREWSELNMNIRNILIALSCRRNKIAYNHLIVGKNDIATLLRSSSNPFHDLIELIDYFEFIKEIDEITDLVEKEQRLDHLLWEWIDDKSVFHYFDIEKIMGYLFKLQIIERWRVLSPEKGAEIFRKIVLDLKKSVETLEHF